MIRSTLKVKAQFTNKPKIKFLTSHSYFRTFDFVICLQLKANKVDCKNEFLLIYSEMKSSTGKLVSL